MLLQVIHFLLAREFQIADRRDDLQSLPQDFESQVKAHLVVARAGAAMGYRLRADELGVARRFQGLKNPLGAY